MAYCKPLKIALLLLFVTSACAQTQTKTRTEEKFFNKKDLCQVGVYYYPEQWPEAQWERDIANIAALGFEFIHFAEFAWSRMEPVEGDFQFGWLDKAISLSAKNGLKVILCTPSATPPAWLSQKHPEILMVNEDGRQMQHGSRQFASWSSDMYKIYVRRIVTAMGNRYSKDKRIWGWQLDNEPSHYGSPYDYSAPSKTSFVKFLQEKYKNISALNLAWGNAFWSQEYNTFEQIHIPNQKETVQVINPHALLDFQMFNNEALGHFMRMQSEILKATGVSDQFITTNYNNNLPVFDPFINQKDLDFAAFTFYPVNSWSGDAGGDLGFRLGSGLELSFYQEYCRSVNGYTGIMELQPGQVNWGRFNSQPLPGAIRMWMWHTFALGADFICTYRYRQPLSGNEQYHNGIMSTDGITLSRGGEEYVQTIKELKALRDKISALTKATQPATSLSCAILWDQKSMLDMKNFPHTQQWDAMRLVYNYYAALKSMGVKVTFLKDASDLDPVKNPFLIVPSVQLIDKSTVEQWSAYAAAGGHLLISPRTGQKDRNAHLWESTLQQPIYSLIGAKILYNDQLPNGKSGKLNMHGNTLKWDVWSEVLSPIKTTSDKEAPTMLASYSDQFYKDSAAVINRKLGKGTVTYAGTCSSNGELEKEILKFIYNQASIETMQLPPYIFYECRDGFHIVCNYSSSAYQMTLKSDAEILFGSKSIAPGKVLVWR